MTDGILRSVTHFSTTTSAVAPVPEVLFLDSLSTAAARAYSLRKVSSAYAGSAIRVRRASDSTEQDIGFSGNDLDTASLASFCSGTDGFVTRWYDQSTAADNAIQATAGTQPVIVTAGTIDTENGLPTMRCNRNKIMLSASSTNVQEIVALYTIDAASWANFDGLVSDNTANSYLSGDPAGHWDNSFCALPSVAFLLDNLVGTVPVFSGTLQHINGRGTSAVAGGRIQLFQRITDTARRWGGACSEIIIFATSLSSGDRTTAYTNQKTYWGTP